MRFPSRYEARKLAEGQRLSNAFTQAGKLPEVTREKIIEHIEHAIAVAGAAHVGLGSDFDGAFMPTGMEDASKFPSITESCCGAAIQNPMFAKSWEKILSA